MIENEQEDTTSGTEQKKIERKWSQIMNSYRITDKFIQKLKKG